MVALSTTINTPLYTKTKKHSNDIGQIFCKYENNTITQNGQKEKTTITNKHIIIKAILRASMYLCRFCARNGRSSVRSDRCNESSNKPQCPRLKICGQWRRNPRKGFACEHRPLTAVRECSFIMTYE